MKDLLLKYKTLIILVSISLIVFFIVNFVILKDDTPKKANTKTNVSSNTETITPNTTTPNNNKNTTPSTSNQNGDKGISTALNVNNKIWGNGNKDDDSYVIDKGDLEIFKSNNMLKEYKKDPFSINVVDKDKFLNGFYCPNEIQESPTTTDNNTNTNADTKSNNATTGTNTNATTSNSNLTPAKDTTPTTTKK